MRRFFTLLFFTVAGAAFGGCGVDGYASLGLVKVSGTVTLDGKPLSGAKVAFEGADRRQAIGVTDSVGRYELMYDSATFGVTPGPKTVRITLADANLEGGGASEGQEPADESIPARYNRESELKAEVSSGSRSFDFSLKTK